MNRRTFLRSLGLGLLVGPHLVRHTTQAAPERGLIPADRMDAIIDELNRIHVAATCDPRDGTITCTFTHEDDSPPPNGGAAMRLWAHRRATRTPGKESIALCTAA